MPKRIAVSEREPDGERDQPAIDVDPLPSFHVADEGWRQVDPDQAHADPGDCERSRHRKQRQHAALDQHLADDAEAAGAKGGAHGEFALPFDTAREQQVGDVGARDQQHEARPPPARAVRSGRAPDPACPGSASSRGHSAGDWLRDIAVPTGGRPVRLPPPRLRSFAPAPACRSPKGSGRPWSPRFLRPSRVAPRVLLRAEMRSLPARRRRSRTGRCREGPSCR